jgi:hypothetical protein
MLLSFFAAATRTQDEPPGTLFRVRIQAFGAVIAAVIGLGCRADPIGTAGPVPSASAAPSVAPRIELDTTPLAVAPSLADIAGFWIVESAFRAPLADPPQPGGASDDPGSRPGSAWWFGPDAIRLVFGDASDRRPITAVKVEGNTLRIEIEGSDLLVTGRRAGIAVRSDNEETRVPLRRATQKEIAAIEKADARRGKMLERACEKALECCVAARGKGLATEVDCKPLLGPPDLQLCIQAITVFKNKAAAAKITIAECLPDK